MGQQRTEARLVARRNQKIHARKSVVPKRAEEEGRRSDGIVGHFRRLIFRGNLKPDDCLPSERDLARQFRVGRPTVREAIQQLAGLGLVEVRRAQGTFVRPLSPEVLGSPLRQLAQGGNHDLMQIVDVRMGLEGWAAAEAARRATPDQVRRINAIVERMERAVAKGRSLSELDLAFHCVLVEAADNTVLLRLIEALTAMIGMVKAAKRLVAHGAVPHGQVIAVFRNIAQAIASRDPERARRGMIAHLELVRTQLPTEDAPDVSRDH